jgi:hypothetical protein
MHSSSDASTLDRTVPAHALWNPLAAAFWSLIFTPAFGAWLLMRNWEALGEQRHARTARAWFCFSVGLLVVRLLAGAINMRLNSQSNFIHWVSLLYLAVWWLAAAVPQFRLVQSRLGADYPRQGWDYALLLGVLGGFSYYLMSALLTWVFVTAT